MADSFVLPDDLSITLGRLADVFNPTNIDVDARGRVWITEAVTAATSIPPRTIRSSTRPALGLAVMGSRIVRILLAASSSTSTPITTTSRKPC